MPEKKAALNSVVATWLMPPPTASSKRPLKICGAETNPFASVRLPSAAVERELLPGKDDRPVEERGGPLDVRHARRATRVVRRELGHELGDPQLLPPRRSSASAAATTNRARCARARQVADEGRGDPTLRRARFPGTAGATRTRAPSTTKLRVDGGALEATELRQKLPHGGAPTSSPTRSRPPTGSVVTSPSKRRDREHVRLRRGTAPRGGRRAAVTPGAAPLEPRRRRRSGAGAAAAHRARAGNVRSPRRRAPRSTSVPGAGVVMEMTALPRSTRSAFRGCSPNRRSSRFASSAVRTGPSR